MEKERKEVRIEDAMAEKEALDKKAQEILEEKDADSRLRVYKGPLGKAIIVLLCVWTAFQLYFTTIGAISAVNLRAIPHDFPARLYIPSLPDVQVGDEETEIPPIWDIAFILGSARFLRLPDSNFTRIAQTGGRINNMESALRLSASSASLKQRAAHQENLAILAASFPGIHALVRCLPSGIHLGDNGFTLKRILSGPVLGVQRASLAQASAFSATYIFSSDCLWRCPEAQRIFQIRQ